jgi:hypothetical protein
MLTVAAEAVDHPGRHVVDRDERAGRWAAIGHRLHDQRRLEPSEADPAAFLADIDRGEPEFGRGLDRLAREDMVFIPLRSKGRDPVGGKPPGHLLNGKLVFVQLKLVGHGAPLAAGRTRFPAARLLGARI